MSAVMNEYKYCLRGKYGTIVYTTYSEVNDHFKKIPRSMRYKSWEDAPRDVDFLLKYINDDVQKPYLDELVEKIKNTTGVRDDQVRIAVSLVQHIDYDFDGVNNGSLTDKYPYEVLHTRCGVCEEKSRLLAYLLRGLGYGSVLFRFPTHMHATTGIKCPREYSYKATGFCFVESNRPEIITNSENEYMGGGKLNSKPRTLLVSNGFSFDSILEEFNDANEYNTIITKGRVGDTVSLSILDYNKLSSITKKYGINLNGNNNAKTINPDALDRLKNQNRQIEQQNQQDRVIKINVDEIARNTATTVNDTMNKASGVFNDLVNNANKYFRKIGRH